MPLMGSLYVGTSGLQTSQNALNTTAHNLTNLETVGYVRQQVQQGSRSYLTLSINPKSISNQQTGLGVNYSRVKHIRDYFYDKAYRRESGRSMFYEVSTEVLEHVENQLGEMHGEAFQTSIEDYWTAIQELAKDPASSVTQGLFVQRAAELLQRAQAVYEGFCTYQDNLNLQIKDQVDKINKYGKQIITLNETIRSIEAGGIESANDLRDARDQILDELSELVNMSYGENAFGEVWVQIEGVDFVKGPDCYEMGLFTDEDTGFYTPFWPDNARYETGPDGEKIFTREGIQNAKVFKLNREISTDLNTDIGGLKSMLLARGDHRANCTDIDKDNFDAQYDEVSQSIIMNIQAEFDQLIHNIAVTTNAILAKAAGVVTGDLEVVDEDGNTVKLENVKYCKADSDGYMRNDDGSPIQVFSKIGSDGYRKVTGTDGVEYWVYNEEPRTDGDGHNEKDYLYTIENLEIETELLQKPSMLGLRLADGSEDKATANALKDAFQAEDSKLNPNVQKKSSFISYYTDLVSQVANTGYMNRNIYYNQLDELESLESARQQVAGVSSDEELSNMIKFQNAYNAASRYINVLDEMLEHILSTLGR